MKIGIHFGHWGSFYGQLGVRECLKQAKKAGADVLEFFPTEEMFALEKEKIRDLKKYMEELAIAPAFTFGYPAGWDMAGEDEVLREKATEQRQWEYWERGILAELYIPTGRPTILIISSNRTRKREKRKTALTA